MRIERKTAVIAPLAAALTGNRTQLLAVRFLFHRR
jgi:hypothetical protein